MRSVACGLRHFGFLLVLTRQVAAVTLETKDALALGKLTRNAVHADVASRKTSIRKDVLPELPMLNFVGGAPATTKTSSPPPSVETTPSPEQGASNLDQLRFTMARIQTVTGDNIDWSRPWEAPPEYTVTGSGFAVDLTKWAPAGAREAEGPAFLTNAHVVRDAHSVQVQMPALGKTFFEAHVPVICHDFDLAVVRLVEPQRLFAELAAQNVTLRPIEVSQGTTTVGMEVAALGFPLGTASLKVSKGIISGTELVDTSVVYQSTAPISPGSSGGPLVDLMTLRVIGVNFASSSRPDSQNVNFVVPDLHILKVLHKFRHRMELAQARDRESAATAAVPSLSSSAPSGVGLAGSLASRFRAVFGVAQTAVPTAAPQAAAAAAAADAASAGTVGNSSVAAGAAGLDAGDAGAAQEPLSLRRPAELRLAPIGATVVEASEGHYLLSGGCHQGVFLSSLQAKSALRFADPPLQQHSFILSVDNITVDSSGAGRSSAFLGDPLPLETLFQLREDLTQPVEVSSCFQGVIRKHTVPIEWKPMFELGIAEIVEPTTSLAQAAQDFELFAGVLVMQMNVNQVEWLMSQFHMPTLGRWLLPGKRLEPRLIITDVAQGSYASRVLSTGMVLETLNGHKVSTLDDFRAYFVPGNGSHVWPVWHLETELGVLFATDFRKELQSQLDDSEKLDANRHLLTRAVRDATNRLLAEAAAASKSVPGGGAAPGDPDAVAPAEQGEGGTESTGQVQRPETHFKTIVVQGDANTDIESAAAGVAAERTLEAELADSGAEAEGVDQAADPAQALANPGPSATPTKSAAFTAKFAVMAQPAVEAAAAAAAAANAEAAAALEPTRVVMQPTSQGQTARGSSPRWSAGGDGPCLGRRCWRVRRADHHHDSGAEAGAGERQRELEIARFRVNDAV